MRQPETPHKNNVKYGAKVVNKAVFEAVGIDRCLMGEITNYEVNSKTGQIGSIEVTWLQHNPNNRRFIYEVDSLLVVVGKNRPTNNNPNLAFKTKRKRGGPL